MVYLHQTFCLRAAYLSVLALSSRFDGHIHIFFFTLFHQPFSTRSVESF